jgi:Cof subfamily protein (haloacid dehalogenase superfamily)
MIALDLDGTLLKSNASVSSRNRKALQAAHKNGIEIVLASGRMTPAMEDAAAQLGFDVHLVSYNGAAVCSQHAHKRERLFHQPLPAAVAKDLFQVARERRLQVNFYHNDVIVSEDAPHLRPHIDVYRSRTQSPFRFVDRLDDYLHESPTKMLFVVDPAIRNPLSEELARSFGQRATIVRTDPEYLEFLDPAIDKGRGVERLAAMLNIPMQAIMAMGDGENDVTMLRSVGFGVSVANAGAPAKSAAKSVTQNDHNNDAVAEAIERWVL